VIVSVIAQNSYFSQKSQNKSFYNIDLSSILDDIPKQAACKAVKLETSSKRRSQMNINSDPFRSLSLVFLIMVGIVLFLMFDRSRQEVEKLQLIHETVVLAKDEEIAALQQRNQVLMREAAESADQLAAAQTANGQLTRQVADLTDQLTVANGELDDARAELAAQPERSTSRENPCATQVQTENPPASDPVQVDVQAMTIPATTTWTLVTIVVVVLFILMGLGVVRRITQAPGRVPETARPTAAEQSSLRPLVLRPINNSRQRKQP
jgi:hypothetical protein